MKFIRNLAVTWFTVGGVCMFLYTIVLAAGGDPYQIMMGLLGTALNFIFAYGWKKSF